MRPPHTNRPTGFGRASRWRLLAVLVAGLLSACAGSGQRMTLDLQANEPLLKGPAVMDVVTPFDNALSCLDGRISKDNLRFSVGAILDATGKEQVTDGGSGKFVTQGAGDIVQSALFMAGATVVNRRDPRIIDNEVRWGLLDAKKQSVSTFFITGSINSLDFLPGGGFDVQIAGIGPRYRQQRILVGLDLSLTEASTGRIVANVPLQKQVVSTEDGFGVGRFFGQTLVSADFGGKQREALHLVLRQMLNLATFELLTQVMNPARYGDCMALVEVVDGVTDNSRSRRRLQQYLTEQTKAVELAAKSGRPAKPVGPPDNLGVNPQATANVVPPVTAGPADAGKQAPAGVAVAANPNPNAGPVGQNANFSDEQSSTPASTLQALAIPRPMAGAAEALSSNGNGNAQVLAAVATAARVENPGVPGCSFAAGEFPQVTPLRADEPGNTLLVRSRTAQTLCLADPSGRFVPHALVAGAEQRFEGRPPWKLQAERLNEIDIVYQGLPLRRPGYIKDRMELLERPLSAPAG
jgi:curli biogenesis system outer membrane secretion channel CsgG